LFQGKIKAAIKQHNKTQNKKQLKHMFIIIVLLCLSHAIAALQVGSLEFYVSAMPGKYESCQIALAEQTKGCTIANKNLYEVRFELKKNAHQLHYVNKQLNKFSQKYIDTNQKDILLSSENIKLQEDIVQYGFSQRNIFNSLCNADRDDFEKKQIIADLNKQLQEAEQKARQRAFYSHGLTLAFIVTIFCFFNFWLRTRQSTATNANKPAATTQAASSPQRNAPVLTKNDDSNLTSQGPSPTATPPTATPTSVTTPTPIDEVKISSATPRRKSKVYSRTSPPARTQGSKSRWIIRGNKAYSKRVTSIS
jgi:uncharacterized coiled-coil protein SlyX